MENEIMINEEVVEEAAEVAGFDSKKGLIAVAIGAAAIVGVVVYKKVVKPMIAKRKAQKEQAVIEGAFEETAEVEVKDSEEI